MQPLNPIGEHSEEEVKESFVPSHHNSLQENLNIQIPPPQLSLEFPEETVRAPTQSQLLINEYQQIRINDGEAAEEVNNIDGNLGDVISGLKTGLEDKKSSKALDLNNS